MPKVRNFQTNFSGGLLSSSMQGRVDLAQYENGCQLLDNWWPNVSGGMRRRPGSLYLNQVGSTDSRLESFIFNEDQTYAVVFGTNTWNVYDPDDGTLLDGGSTPYSADEVAQLSITQRADVMFIAHPDYQTKKITRTGASTFVIGLYEFEGSPPDGEYPKHMPFTKFASPEVTMNVTGHTGSVQCIASEAAFHANLVGHAVRYRGKQIKVTGYSSPSAIQGTVLEQLDQGAILTFSTAEFEPEDFEIGEICVGRDSGVKCEVVSRALAQITVSMIAGKFAPGAQEEIEGLDSGNIAKILGVQTVAPVAHANWDEEAFSEERGWPGIIEFHSQRLWLGGSSSLPAHIFGSKVAAFFNFDTGSAFPDESIQAAIASRQVARINDIASARHLQVFTDNGEWYAPESDQNPLIPETFNLLPQTHYGVKRNIDAKVFDESTIFVQNQGSAVREFIYRDLNKGYSSDAISLISQEALNDVQELEVLYGAYDRPEQLALFVNGDGTIAWWHSARNEQIRTWGRWTTQGKYKSLTVIADKLYAIVHRDQNFAGPTYLERFELDLTLDAAIKQNFWNGSSFDSETTHPGIAAMTPHAYMTVGVNVSATPAQDATPSANQDLADYYLGEFELSPAGHLTIPTAMTNLTVGLKYDQTLEPMPFEVSDQAGVTGGMPKRIVSIDVLMKSTLSIKINGHRVSTFQAQNDFNVKPSTISGLRKFYLVGYDERPTVTISNDIPLKCEVLALSAEVEY